MSEPHSAAYFGDQRDFWWNDDFLSLMGRRLGLERIGEALDAGAGQGHWGRALLPHLPNARITGVDREPRWVEEATRRASAAGLSSRLSFRQGDVCALDFANESFDLVTCQTVLIHVADVPAVLREFTRVLRPGGLLLAVEPNNLANALCVGSARGASLLERVELLRFQATCELGKRSLGEGDNSVGDLLPGLFATAGLVDVRAWQSDRASVLVPPYASRAEQALVRDLEQFDTQDWWIWSRADTLRYFLAGGGTEAAFVSSWERARAASRAELEAAKAGTLHQAGGAVSYLVAGRRPGR